MPRKKADTPQQRVFLHTSASFEAAWESVLLPWFDRNATRPLQNAAPIVVITPSRTLADFLRRKLVERRMSLLGIQFLTPPPLRELLVRDQKFSLPLREHLRLLLATAAEEFSTEQSKNSSRPSDVLVTQSVAREPDNFLRAIDQVRAAGGELREIDPPVLREIALKFEKLVHGCGFTLLHQADRLLVHNADQEGPAFGDVLIVGFDGAHWPLWHLLHAAVLRSQTVTVLLNDPRDEARGIDEAWIGTWEEHFGAAEPVAALQSEERPFAKLSESDTAGAHHERRREPVENVHFLMARDTSEQARVVAAMAVAFLADSRCENVGVLLPGAGSLARLIAEALEQLRIPHNDSVAHSMRGAFDNEEWRAWLELQSRPQLGPLLRFLNQSSAAVAFFENLSLREIEKELRRACGDILINDIIVLAEYCSRRNDSKKLPAIGISLRRIRILPPQTSFVDFLKLTLSIFREFGWRERAIELTRMSEPWCAELAGNISRRHFLRWLTEIFAESALCREPLGNHPYARVQLLRYDQAENQNWSHLILAGLNEGVWPKRDDESPFLPDEQIAALNARLAALNRRATGEGRFGAGHTIVREDATLCLGARERREIALRQLFNAIESTSEQIAVSAQLYNSSPREQAVNPSEFYTRLYFNARENSLSQRAIDRIHKETADWLGQTKLFLPARLNDAAISQTVAAYCARRASGTRFGEYEFAFRENSPPRKEFSLSATEAARLFTAPALVWIKVFLGLQADEMDSTSWSLATGQWVHHWLAVIGKPQQNEFVAAPTAEKIAEQVNAAANNSRDEMMSILEASNRELPDWWLSGWQNARYLSNRFAAQFTRVTDWPQLATEWMLDSPQRVKIESGDDLRVRGRVDLLLARGDSADGELWIVDYKTGIAAPLKLQRTALRKQLIAGNGVQICIYALALRDAGWRDVGVGLLTRENELDGPQIGLRQIDEHKAIWQQIARMQKTGIFGMLGELRSEFTFTGDYPLAMLSIDQDLLREKWRRTHPAFAEDERE